MIIKSLSAYSPPIRWTDDTPDVSVKFGNVKSSAAAVVDIATTFKISCETSEWIGFSTGELAIPITDLCELNLSSTAKWIEGSVVYPAGIYTNDDDEMYGIVHLKLSFHVDDTLFGRVADWLTWFKNWLSYEDNHFADMMTIYSGKTTVLSPAFRHKAQNWLVEIGSA